MSILRLFLLQRSEVFVLPIDRDVQIHFEPLLVPNRLCVLATPDAVVSSPVAQLSIPINRSFEILRGKLLNY